MILFKSVKLAYKVSTDRYAIIYHGKMFLDNLSFPVGAALFKNERVINRAVEHRAVLFDVDKMSTMILNHLAAPIGISAYKKYLHRWE